MTNLTPYLNAVRERLAKATPGPWEERLGDSTKETLVADVRGLTIYGPYQAVSCGADADVIVHAREDLARLLTLVAAGQEAIASMESCLNAWCERYCPMGSHTLTCFERRDKFTRYQAAVQETIKDA